MKHLNQIRITLFMISISILLIIAGTSHAQAQAQGTVNYNNITIAANCASVAINYTVANSAVTSIFMYAVDANTAAFLDGTDVPATNGAHTATITFGAGPMTNGQQLRIRTNLGALAFVSGVGTCGGANPPPGGTTQPTGNNNPTNNAAPPPTWSGMSDGRLNPDPAEAYTVFCAYDRIFIHGDEPSQVTRLVAILDIESIMALPDGGQYTLPAMTISRVGDTIIIEGTNGYYTPQLRSKTFNFRECMQRNADNGGSYDVNGQALYPQAPQMNNRPPFLVGIVCLPTSTSQRCLDYFARRRARGTVIEVFP